jgi:hypothetical protein
VYAFGPRNGSTGIEQVTIVVAEAGGRGREAHYGEELGPSIS